MQDKRGDGDCGLAFRRPSELNYGYGPLSAGSSGVLSMGRCDVMMR